MKEQETKRTIDEILDVETGEIIKSDIFFQKSESEIIAYRRRLQEAIAGFEPPKFRCAYCNQLLKLSGKATRRGQVSFFSHLYDSDDCEIKTNGELSKEEIEARKYSNIQESERHIKLKNQLAFYLKSTPYISNVEIEKRITSETPYLYWRRPDVYAEYNGKSIVFEIQLSTTFLSVIIERDIFYRFNNTFIVWVFNFSDNKEYVNFQNLMIKDIYYANKRNAFVFDEKAEYLSRKTGELHLLCIWFEPLIKNDVYQVNEGIRKEEYIKISDLKFDDNTYKPYYVDADALFAEYQSGYFESKINFENLHKVRLEKIAKKNKERQHIQVLRLQKITEKKRELIQGVSKLTLFQKGKKWGYEADGIEIIEPKYTEVTDFSNSDYAKVKYNRKYGFINKIGEFVFDPIFIETFNISNNKCIGKYEKEWCIIDLENKSSLQLDCFNVEKLTDNLLRVTHRITKKVFSGVNYGGYNTYSNEHTDTFSICTMAGNAITQCLYCKVYLSNSGKLILKIKEYYLCKDDTGNEVLINEDEKKFIDKIQTGIIDEDGNILIPFEYDNIDDFIDGRAKAKKDSKYGYIDEQGETLIPFEYDNIADFINGKAKTKKNYKYGYIDEQGETLIPFEYDFIADFIYGRAKAKKNGNFGYINEQGETLIPFEYDFIADFIYGRAKAKKNGNFGYINEQGETLIPFVYDTIEDFIDGIAKAKRNYKEGYIDINGNELIQNVKIIKDNKRLGEKFGRWGVENLEGEIIIPFEYDNIDDFIDGRAKAIKDSKYGYIDEQGETLIPFKYDNIDDFIDGRAKAIKNSKYGYIDEQGETLIPFEYDNIGDFIDGRAKAIKDSKYGYIDEQGETLIPFEYDIIADFINGKAKAKKKYKYGYIDEQGETIIPFEYDNIADFINGKAKAIKKDKYDYNDKQGKTFIQFKYLEDRVKAKMNYKYGYIDEQGETLIPFEYDNIDDFIDGRAKAIKDSKYGYIDEQGETLIPFVYDTIEDFIDGIAKAKRNYKEGYIDINGNELIQNVQVIKNKIRKGEKFGKWGVENLEGDVIIPFVYDNIDDFIDGKAKAIKKGKYGYIDEQGETLIPFVYDNIEDFIDGRVKAKKNYKYGYIDEQGETLIPFVYDTIEDFIDGRAKASINRELAIIDNNGNGIVIFSKSKIFKGKYGKKITEYLFGIKDTQDNIILMPRYNKIDEFKNGLAKIYGDKKYIGGGKFSPKFKYKVGYVDITGKIAAPCVFDEISEFVDGIAVAKRGGENLVVNIYGNVEEKNSTDLSEFKIKSIHSGKINNVAKFGLFVELDNGITALLHISELNKHKKSPADYFRGQEIKVQIINIDEMRNRISLTLSQNENK